MGSIIERIRANNDYFEDFITRSTYNSTHIEGNTLTYGETYSIIFNKNDILIKNATARDLYEAINHKIALDYILKSINKEFSIELIRHIGILINKNINEISDFRKIPVSIKGAQHLPPRPEEVRVHLYHFIDDYNNAVYSDIFEKVSKMHIMFERIHPFEDGNGRVGRILINYELLKNDYFPVIIPYENRNEYFEMLAHQDVPSMQNMIRELHKEEILRAQQFGIDINKKESVMDKCKQLDKQLPESKPKKDKGISR